MLHIFYRLKRFLSSFSFLPKYFLPQKKRSSLFLFLRSDGFYLLDTEQLPQNGNYLLSEYRYPQHRDLSELLLQEKFFPKQFQRRLLIGVDTSWAITQEVALSLSFSSSSLRKRSQKKRLLAEIEKILPLPSNAFAHYYQERETSSDSPQQENLEKEASDHLLIPKTTSSRKFKVAISKEKELEELLLPLQLHGWNIEAVFPFSHFKKEEVPSLGSSLPDDTKTKASSQEKYRRKRKASLLLPQQEYLLLLQNPQKKISLLPPLLKKVKQRRQLLPYFGLLLGGLTLFFLGSSMLLLRKEIPLLRQQRELQITRHQLQQQLASITPTFQELQLLDHQQRYLFARIQSIKTWPAAFTELENNLYSQKKDHHYDAWITHFEAKLGSPEVFLEGYALLPPKLQEGTASYQKNSNKFPLLSAKKASLVKCKTVPFPERTLFTNEIKEKLEKFNISKKFFSLDIF